MKDQLKNKLFGLNSDHVEVYKDNISLSAATIKELRKAQALASQDNIQIEVISGYRSFERQLVIWNEKALGKRPIYNENNELLNIKDMSEVEIMNSILKWSALPGASRHHWGTDFDIYDLNQIKAEDLKLTTSEYDKDGPCYNLSEWINSKIDNKEINFTLPYRVDLGGVAREPWHLSYSQESEMLLKELKLNDLKSIIEGSEIELKSCIIEHLSVIYEQYILAVSP